MVHTLQDNKALFFSFELVELERSSIKYPKVLEINDNFSSAK